MSFLSVFFPKYSLSQLISLETHFFTYSLRGLTYLIYPLKKLVICADPLRKLTCFCLPFQGTHSLLTPVSSEYPLSQGESLFVHALRGSAFSDCFLWILSETLSGNSIQILCLSRYQLSGDFWFVLTLSGDSSFAYPLQRGAFSACLLRLLSISTYPLRWPTFCLWSQKTCLSFLVLFFFFSKYFFSQLIFAGDSYFLLILSMDSLYSYLPFQRTPF